MRPQSSYPNIRKPYIPYFQSSPNHHLFSTPTQHALRNSINRTPVHSNLISLPTTPLDTFTSPSPHDFRYQQPLQLIQYQKHQRSLQTSQDKENINKLVTMIPEPSRSCEKLLQVLNCKPKKKELQEKSISDSLRKSEILEQKISKDVNGFSSVNKILQFENEQLKKQLKHYKFALSKVQAENRKLEQQIQNNKEEKKKLYEILEQKVYQTKNLIESVKELKSTSPGAQKYEKILKEKESEFSTLKNQLNIQNQKILQLQRNQLLSMDQRNLTFLQDENTQLKQEITQLKQGTQQHRVLTENNHLQRENNKTKIASSKQNTENQLTFYQREAARLNQLIFKR